MKKELQKTDALDVLQKVKQEFDKNAISVLNKPTLNMTKEFINIIMKNMKQFYTVGVKLGTGKLAPL